MTEVEFRIQRSVLNHIEAEHWLAYLLEIQSGAVEVIEDAPPVERRGILGTIVRSNPIDLFERTIKNTPSNEKAIRGLE